MKAVPKRGKEYYQTKLAHLDLGDAVGGHGEDLQLLQVTHVLDAADLVGAQEQTFQAQIGLQILHLLDAVVAQLQVDEVGELQDLQDLG